jgi:hypothetical protein
MFTERSTKITGAGLPFQTKFSAHFASSKGKREIAILFVCLSVPVLVLSEFPDFHEIWYKSYAIGGRPNRKIFNFVHSVITIWRAHELVKWKRH